MASTTDLKKTVRISPSEQKLLETIQKLSCSRTENQTFKYLIQTFDSRIQKLDSLETRVEKLEEEISELRDEKQRVKNSLNFLVKFQKSKD